MEEIPKDSEGQEELAAKLLPYKVTLTAYKQALELNEITL